MLGVPPEDGLGDWRGDPLAHPAVPHVGALCRQLRAVGISAERAALLDAVARRVGQERTSGGGALPTQVIHGDLAAWNILVDEDTGEVSGLLDFEFAGVGFLVQEVMAALFYSGALETRDWQLRTAAFLRGTPRSARWTPPRPTRCPGCSWPGRSAASCGGRASG